LSRIESPTKAVLEALGNHLDNRMPKLKQVLLDFPEANINLLYPALSIATGNVAITPENPPYIQKQDAAIGTQAKIYYVVGKFDWQFQIDIWERSKEQRHDMFQEFITAFNSEWPFSGVSLTLKDYHDVICNYLITDYSLQDTEASSQRKEWRATVEVIANCKLVMTKDEYLMQSHELTLEIDPQEM
jgi:hypothetical protein